MGYYEKFVTKRVSLSTNLLKFLDKETLYLIFNFLMTNMGAFMFLKKLSRYSIKNTSKDN